MTIESRSSRAVWTPWTTDPGGDDEQQRTLVAETYDQFCNALGRPQFPGTQPLVRALLGQRVHGFVQHVVTYDALVGRVGLRAGAAWVLDNVLYGTHVTGHTALPHSGPLLLVANHPGMYDTQGVVAHLPRDDVRIVAAERPFWHALPQTARYLLQMSDNHTGRLRVVRSALRHLRAGGTLLTYPAGTIEPDPLHFADALPWVDQWSDSIALFVRQVPGLTVVPVIVGGVFDLSFLQHPLVRLQRDPQAQRWLAATLQFARPTRQAVQPRVVFGQPFRAASHTADGAAELTALVYQQARTLIQQLYREVPR